MTGVAVVLISAVLVFFVSLKMMKESSYEEAAAEKARRQEAFEKEMGIFRTRDVKKESKKKKEKKVKAMKELEQIEKLDEQDAGLDISKHEKGKKSQTTISKIENSELGEKALEKALEKADVKKSRKTAQPRSVSRENNGKAKIFGKCDLDDLRFSEPETRFIAAEHGNKKKPILQSETFISSVPAVKQAMNQSVTAKPASTTVKAQANAKTSTNDPSLKQNTIEFSKPVVVKNSPTLSDTSEWTTKMLEDDSIAITKIQTDENNEELVGLRTQLLMADRRLEEVRQELRTVSQNYSVLENKAKTDLADKAKEIDALKMRLNRAPAERPKEPNQQLHHTQKGPDVIQPNSGEAQLIQILTDENRKLKQELSSSKTSVAAGVSSSSIEDLQLKVKLMDDALRQNAILLNASENAKKTLEQKLKQAESRLNSMEILMKTAERKAQTGSEELKRSEAEVKSLSDALKTAQKDSALSQELLSKAKGKEKCTRILEEKVTSLESQFQVLEQLITRKDRELESWKEKNGRLVEELNKSNKTLQGLEEQEKRNEGNRGRDEELSLKVEQLKEELTASKASKAELETELSDSMQHQNRLQADLLHYQTVLADMEKTLTQLQTNVECEDKSREQKLSTAEDQLITSRDELEQLQEELDQLSKKHETRANHIEGSSVDTRQTDTTLY